jgi:hypothetical protein
VYATGSLLACEPTAPKKLKEKFSMPGALEAQKLIQSRTSGKSCLAGDYCLALLLFLQAQTGASERDLEANKSTLIERTNKRQHWITRQYRRVGFWRGVPAVSLKAATLTGITTLRVRSAAFVPC